MTHGPTTRPRLICLLPARNAAADLPGYFASVEQFADAIVALDDGSTDATAELLASHPLVKILLRNPQRPDYRGWNDAANRNRLLEAAASLNPEWIISLDADERIDPTDAEALRTFLATDALPGCAYGFQCFPMHRDLTHYLPTFIWVYRLFAFEPGQRFPDRRLHFSPIPTSIPRQAFIRTTLRIQHLGNLTPERRRARFEKYRQADPHCAFWPDYSSLLEAPDESALQVWQPRSPGTPILLPPPTPDAPGPRTEPACGTQAPALTVIVLAEDGSDPEETLQSLSIQPAPGPVETVLVAPAQAPWRRHILDRWPALVSVPVPDHCRPGVARNAGLMAATGRFVLFLTTRMTLMPGALAALVAAHERGYAMVTGPLLRATPSAAAVAQAIVQQLSGSRRRASGVITGSLSWCSYARGALEEIGGFPDDLPSAEEVVAIERLRRRGYLAYYEEAAALRLRLEPTAAAAILAQAYWRGIAQGYALGDASHGGPTGLRRLILRDPARRLRSIPHRVWQYPAPRRTRLAALPVVALGEVAAWIGRMRAVMRSRQALLQLFGWQPPGLLLLTGRAGEYVDHIAVIDVAPGLAELRGLVLPRDAPARGMDGQAVSLATAVATVHSRADLLATTGNALGLPLSDFITVNLGALGWQPALAQEPVEAVRWTLTAMANVITPRRLATGRYRQVIRGTSLRIPQLAVWVLLLRSALRLDPSLGELSITDVTSSNGTSLPSQITEWWQNSPARTSDQARWDQLRELPLI